MSPWIAPVIVFIVSCATTAMVALALRRLRSDDAPTLVDLDESRERETLPPGADLGDPADLLASVAVRMERTADSLASVSRELASVARDIAAVRQQQQTHGKAIGLLQDTCARLERRVSELEATVHRRSP
jgi:hypothetical protein